MEILEDFLYQQGTMEAYTILMDFQIGTRIGELVVLKQEDMLDDEVYIHKMEIVDEERVDGVYIRKGYDTTKGYIYNYNEIEKNRSYMDKAL
jgi:hypothetical protein